MELRSVLPIFFTFLLDISRIIASDNVIDADIIDRFKIEGKVDLTVAKDKDWLSQTRVIIDGGEFLGNLRSDGSFVVNDLPSGTYVVEVAHPEYIYEAARVDITSKGKIRARRVNYLQPSIVKTIQYPLEFKERQKAKYFQLREQWRITDFLMNPMEMQSQMKAFNDKSNLPDMSEMLTSLFGGDQKKSSKTKAVKKR